MMKTRTMLVVSAFMVLTTSCNKSTTNDDNPIKVKTILASATPDCDANSYSGTIEAQNGISLSFPVGGTVKQFNCAEGAQIKKGQLLAVLDATTMGNLASASSATVGQAQAALAQMELSAEQAADAYKRMKLLHDNGSLPEIKWVEVQTRYQQAKDAVRLAKATVQAAKAQKNISQKNLSDTRLYAPSAGFLSKKITEVGQNVAPGQPVATLVDIQQVKVKINVAEDDRAKIHVGQTFRFTVSSLPGKTFIAHVTEIGVAADPITRSYEVKAVADNAQHQLLPGMVCDVKVQATAPSSAIMLPANIIQIDFDNRPFVWTVVKGMARKTYVIIGQSAGDYVQITTGLSTKDVVIVEGQQKVSNGMRVE